MRGGVVSVLISRLPKRFLPAALVYTLCLALIAAVISFVTHERFGAPGARASLFASLVCWGAGLGALGCVSLFARTPQQVVGLLGSIFFRTGLPLVGLALLKQMPELEAAGGGFILMTTYLISLFLDVLLTVGLIYDPAASVKAARAKSSISREVG
jgi:hypothetical protein